MKNLTVPFHKQQTDYTCGPASLRMVLEYFGRSVTEEELSPLLGTNDVMGTERDRMSEIIKTHELVPYERTDATLDDVKHLLSHAMPVIVRFLEQEQNSDHYGVVTGLNDTHITINDPWSGANVIHEIGIFLMRWPCTYKNGQTCWMLGVGDRKLV